MKHIPLDTIAGTWTLNTSGEYLYLQIQECMHDKRIKDVDLLVVKSPRVLPVISCIMQYILDIMQDICYIDVMINHGNIKLKLARIEKNLTQQELADRVNVTRQTIGLIEKGNYNPTLNLCINIAKTLDRTLDQLFWEVDQDEYEILQTG